MEELLQLTVFSLAGEEYAVDILRVRGIERLTEVTRVPQAPDYVEGVINLRGRIVPVVNLRKRLALPENSEDKSAKIIVVERDQDMVGLRVDSVREVLRIPRSKTEPPPDLASQNAPFVERLAKLDDRLILILDVERVLADAELSGSQSEAQAEASESTS